MLRGAFHGPALTGELPAMTDRELASLPRRTSKVTLMPYSYFRLSSQSGYGAGNHAPAYFELLWQALNEHADLVEAIIAGEVAAAGSIAERHFEITRDIVQRVLDRPDAP